MVGKRTPIDVKQCEARLSQRVTVLRAALKDHGDAGARAASGPSPIEVHDLKEQAFEGQLASLSGVTREQMLGELAAAQGAVQRLPGEKPASPGPSQRPSRWVAVSVAVRQVIRPGNASASRRTIGPNLRICSGIRGVVNLLLCLPMGGGGARLLR